MDLLAETDLLDAAVSFVKRLGLELRDALAKYDVSARLGAIGSRAAEGYESFKTRSDTHWLTQAESRTFVAGVRVSVARDHKAEADARPLVAEPAI